MTREEEQIAPIRNLWAAVVGQAIDDYRKAILYDRAEARTIEIEMEVMGYADYMPLLKERALAFRSMADREAKTLSEGEHRLLDCPSCGKRESALLFYRNKSIWTVCPSCQMRYLIRVRL